MSRRNLLAVRVVGGAGRASIAALGVTLALTLSGCAASPSAVRVQQADTGIPVCRSFEWLPTSKEAASLNEQRIRAAVMAQLQEKGYAQSSGSEGPSDCRIIAILAISTQERAKPRIGVGAGGGSRGIGGGVGVSLPVGRKPQQTGTVTLDVIDVASNAQVWSGSLDVGFTQAELSDEEANAVVQTILAEFPDARAAPVAP